MASRPWHSRTAKDSTAFSLSGKRHTTPESGPILGAHVPGPPHSARLLAADLRGYRRIARILSRFHERKNREAPFSLLQALREDRRGVHVLSTSRALLETLARESSPQGLWVALYPLGPQHSLIRFSRRSGVPLAAVAPVYFLDAADHCFHKVLRAVGLSAKLDRVPECEQAPPWAFFQPVHRWRERYLHCPGALEGMKHVAEQCTMEAPPWGDWVFPPFQGLSAQAAFARLDRAARNGAHRRYGGLTPPVLKRLHHELEIIREKNLASYFLVVEDIVQRFPITCGRGSAAASLVSYCLGITHVDPLKHDLFFERFLNRGRLDPPDIDVDFPWDERDQVLRYVLDTYGPEHCAMVANHVGFRARAAIREVAKVYGIPAEEIGRVSATFRHGGNPFKTSLEKPPEKSLEMPLWKDIVHWARRLEGLPRHLSVHCGGVVITPDPLPERVPVEQAARGVPVIQWEKDFSEESGLVKIDLLGNRSLAVIRDTLSALRENGHSHLTYAGLNPLEDPGTQKMLARGDTVGVFYVESPAMRQLLRKTGKGDYAHLVVQSSIIRPAANEFIREYVRRVRGGTYTALHPLLEDILRETHGILCYQEDVSRVAMALAGFDAVQADQLRKIMSKKHRHAKLADFRNRFVSGATERGVPPGVVEEVWRMVLSFQGYSFCKPHSASYALVSFKACFLKAHHPAEFMAAVISNRGGYYTTLAYLSEARRMGLHVLPPDVNESRWAYTGRNRDLRVGLMQLKGVRRASLEALLEDRKRRGPFCSPNELFLRVDADPADFKTMIKAGCMDSISQGRSRPGMLWEWLAWQAHRGTGKGKPRCDTGETLWSADGGEHLFPCPRDFLPPSTRPYGDDLELRHELETLGLLVSRHPLELFRPHTDRFRAVPASELPRHVGRRVTVLGWFVTGKTVLTRQQEAMEFVSFEDPTALYETTFFPRAYKRFRHIVGYSRPYVLQGRVEEDYGAISLTTENVQLGVCQRTPNKEAQGKWSDARREIPEE